MEVLLALVPFVVLVLLVLVTRRSARDALFAALCTAFVIAFFYWQVEGNVLAAATVMGVFIAIEIVLIVFGALVLYEVAVGAGCIAQIRRDLHRSKAGRYSIVLVVAWAFGAMIEGAAGFGVPAALAAPLLVGVGFSPVVAVALSLIANSVPVSFGALGTPVVVGVGSVAPHLVADVTRWTGVIHALVGVFVPFVLVLGAAIFSGRSFKEGLSSWRVCVLAVLVLLVPYVVLAWFVGPQFVSFVAGGIALAVLLAVLKVRTSVRAWIPYIVAAIVLVALRLLLPFLQKVLFSTGDLFMSGVSYGVAPLASAGVALFVSAMCTWLVLRGSWQMACSALARAWSRVAGVFVALVSATVLVQIVLLSGMNLSGLPSMPSVLASAVVGLPGWLFVLFAPFIGGLGAFIAGSNTVSNLLFVPFQLETAALLGLPAQVVVALQTVGGAAGNMVALHNIVAACATVGLVGSEFEIMRRTILPCLGYLSLAGVVGVCLLALL